MENEKIIGCKIVNVRNHSYIFATTAGDYNYIIGDYPTGKIKVDTSILVGLTILQAKNIVRLKMMLAHAM